MQSADICDLFGTWRKLMVQTVVEAPGVHVKSVSQLLKVSAALLLEPSPW